MATLTREEKKSLEQALGTKDITGFAAFGKEALSEAEHEIVIQAMKADVSECVMKDCWDYEPRMANGDFTNSKTKMYVDDEGKVRKNYDGITDNIFECWFDHPIENDIRLTPEGECWENSPFNRDIVKFENMLNDESSFEKMTGFVTDVDEQYNKDLKDSIKKGFLPEAALYEEPYEVIKMAKKAYAEDCFIAEHMGLEQPEVPEILFNDFSGNTADEFWEEYDAELSVREKNYLLYLINQQEG